MLIEQDALHWGPDQHSSACLPNDGNDVEGKLAGTPPRVVRTPLVVVKEESIDKEAGLLRRDT